MLCGCFFTKAGVKVVKSISNIRPASCRMECSGAAIDSPVPQPCTKAVTTLHANAPHPVRCTATIARMFRL